MDTSYPLDTASKTILGLAQTPHGILWLVIIGLFSIIAYMFSAGISTFKGIQDSTNRVIENNTKAYTDTQSTLVELKTIIKEKLQK